MPTREYLCVLVKPGLDQNEPLNSDFHESDLQDKAFIEIGKSIASWSFVESFLFSVYMRSISSPSKASAAVWDVHQTFAPRLKMTDAALRAQTIFAYDEQAWLKIYKKCRDRSLKRNLIAHGQLFHEPSNNNASERIYLASPLGSFGIKNKTTIKEISDASRSFQELADIIKDFYLSIL
jgi:hypothetical protein